jgi:hypothetical protein
MNGVDGNDRVRPLHEPAPVARSPRPWGPLAVTLAVVAAFTVLVAGMRGGQSQAGGTLPPVTVTTSASTTSAAPPSTTTTQPPSFDLPDGTNRVQVVVFDGARGVVETWAAPRSRTPIVTPLVASPDLAAFNHTGELLAVLDFEPRLSGALHLGPPLGPLRTAFVDVGSVAWHDRDPSALALTARLPFEERVTLLTATVHPLSFELENLTRIVELDEPEEVAAWGDWGFVLAGADDGALDEEGRPTPECRRSPCSTRPGQS